jgi:recombinational DNA repair protein RecR
MKTYKYTNHLNNKEYEAVLKKDGDRCYFCMDKERNEFDASFPIEKYDNFDFYHFLEPFIDKDLTYKPTMVALEELINKIKKQ